MIFGRPHLTIIDNDKKKYAINVQLDYAQTISYVPIILTIPGISAGSDVGQTDILSLQTYQGIVQLPLIKSVMGTVDFQSDSSDPGTEIGALLFYCSDTGHMMSVQPYFSQGDPLAKTVQGNAGRFRSFRLPLLTLGTTIQIFKLVDVVAATPVIKGRMNLNFLTWDDSPFEVQN
jgi:hypothetical protein